MAPWREWWEARAGRERAILAGGAGALVIAIMWAYVWEPLVTERARLVEALPRLRVQSAQVAAQGSEVDQLRAAARARGPTASPQAAVEATLKAAGIGGALSGVTTLGEGRVQVALRPVAFDALVRVLAQLVETNGMTVDSIALKTGGEPGTVLVENLVLRAAQGG